ncbi:hypothetical protein V8F33_012315 [Rhypophila sp. PSN 637]
MATDMRFVDDGEKLKTNKRKGPTQQAMPGKAKRKRERAAHSKARTGCRTCKARRIKCDEQQPACLRCTTTGRTCEGYEPPNPTRWLVVTGPSQPKLPPPPIHSILPTAYPDCLLEDGYVKLSFDFFRNVAAPELSHFFGKSFWSESLLSTSHQFPAVMSAILALSSLHRRFKDGLPIKGDVFAGRQYEKSLKQLIRSISSTTDTSHSRIMSLLCGVIYSVIEVLHGSCNQARRHLDGIIKLLNEAKSTKTAEGGREEVLVADKVMRDLRAIITRFDIEAATYSSRRPPQIALEPLETLGPQRFPSPDLNLDEIEAELCRLMLHAINLIYAAKPYRYEGHGGPVPDQLLYDQENIIQNISLWWANYESTLREAAAGSQSSDDTRRAISLIVHYHTTWTSLNGCIYPSETGYDAYLFNFSEIVHYASLLNDGENKPAQTYHPSYQRMEPIIDPNIDPNLDSPIFENLNIDTSHSTIPASSSNDTFLDVHNLLNPQSRTPSPYPTSPSSTSSTSSSRRQQNSPPPCPKPTSFSPETGLVFPLFWTALRCRDGFLRRQALAQLTYYSFQEGVWIPGAQARVASRVIEIEEDLEPWSVLEACADGFIGSHGREFLPKVHDIDERKRCHHIAWPTDRVTRTGDMVYSVLPQGVEGAWETRSENISY